MGGRFAFAYYAYHSGAGAVARFSVSHDITGAQIWTTALVLMAFGQVLARVGVLQARRLNPARSAPDVVEQDRVAPALPSADWRAERHARHDRRRAGGYAGRPAR